MVLSLVGSLSSLVLSLLFSWGGFYETRDIYQFLVWVSYYDTPGACEAWISMIYSSDFWLGFLIFSVLAYF